MFQALGVYQTVPDDFLDPRTTNELAKRRGLRSSVRWARMPVGLWHYTCTDHGQPGIERDGFLRPNWEHLTEAKLAAMPPADARIHRLTSAVVWMTDLPDLTANNAHIVGLGRDTPQSCDRTAHRYRVDPNTPVGHIMTFLEYLEAGAMPPDVLADLMDVNIDPNHWFVSAHRVRVTAAPR